MGVEMVYSQGMTTIRVILIPADDKQEISDKEIDSTTAFKDLQGLVGEYIGVVRTLELYLLIGARHNLCMVVDEYRGKRRGQNLRASKLYRTNEPMIYGDAVLICESQDNGWGERDFMERPDFFTADYVAGKLREM